MNRILVVEDEEPIANLIRMNLVKNGYQCDCAYDGLEGADRLENGHYDLCLLDVMLPKVNGYELLEYAKQFDIPVIFLTAMGTTADKVKGLKAGADDYIAKPFEVVELLARIESVLRRFHKTEQTIEVLDVVIDIPSRTVSKSGREISLTLKEFELLLLFAQNPNIALYRETIYEQVWQSQIEAVYKIGYRLHVV